MTSDPDRDVQDPGCILWITGLCGAGKTTLARAVAKALAFRGSRLLLLDGDDLRHALDDEAELGQHDLESRRRRAWRIARLARFAAEQDLHVIVATISLFHDIHAWNRRGSVRYAEVVLDAPLLLLQQRNHAVYSGGTNAPPNIVGVDIPAEMPLRPDLVLRQGFEACQLQDHLSQVLALWDVMRCTDPPPSSGPPSR